MLVSTVSINSYGEVLSVLISQSLSLSGKYFISKFLGEAAWKLIPALLFNGFFPFCGFHFHFLGSISASTEAFIINVLLL